MMDEFANVFLLFGASGDLAQLKLYGAFYLLFSEGMFDEGFRLIGFGRTKHTTESFREFVKTSVIAHSKKKIEIPTLDEFLEKTDYVCGDYESKASFASLFQKVQDLKIDQTKRIRIFAYLSIPPSVYQKVIVKLIEKGGGYIADMCLIFEKPFGQNQEDVAQIRNEVEKSFMEKHIYLFDHYAEKITIKDIVALRRDSRIINSLIQGDVISNIQITLFEEDGVEDRLGYFDQVGIIKDMIQSHALTILSNILLNLPLTSSPENLARERYEVLSSLRFESKPTKNSVVIGQNEGYVNQLKSKTETFAAIRLELDSLDWYGVPVYIRVGKKMARTIARIDIIFRLFEYQKNHEKPNRLSFWLKPIEGLEISLSGLPKTAQDDFRLLSTFACEGPLCGSEHAELILSALRGDRSKFVTFDEALASWNLIDQIGEYIANTNVNLEIYSDHTNGPISYLEIPKQDGNEWANFE